MPAFPGVSATLQARQRVLVGVTAAIGWTNVDQDGSPAEPSGAVTVEVQRADGTEVLAGGTATDVGVTAGTRSVTLTAPQNDQLDLLGATWSDAGDGSVHTTYHEVVGGFFFGEAEARSLDPAFVEATYSKADVLAVRQLVEDALERICGHAFVRRFRLATLGSDALVPGRYGASILLPDTFPRTVRSLSIAGAALDAGELAGLSFEDHGELHRTVNSDFARTDGPIVVAYEHGEDYPPPPIKQAALLLFKAWLPALTTSPTGQVGVKSLAVEGYSVTYGEIKGDTTGIDAVDRLIATWRGSEPAFA